MTFSSLEDDIKSYTERGGVTVDSSFASQIPRIINLTERKIARELKIQGFQSVLTSTFTPSISVYAKPSNWRETISMNVGTNLGTATTYNERVIVYPLVYEVLRLYTPNDTTTTTPQFYADYDYQHWIFGPTPDVAYPYESLCWVLPALLDSANTTNWLTEYAPNALLHGCLTESFAYLKAPESAAQWGAIYDRDMAGLSGEDLQKILDRSMERKTA